MKFPFIGSAVLVSLFVCFKFLPKDLVNAALTAYFVLLGTAALTATVLPFVEAAMPEGVRGRAWTLATGLTIPYVLKDPTDVRFTAPEAVAGAGAAAFCAWYCLKKHWLANNALGLAFSVTGIEHLSLGSVTTGAILLAGLFVYDVFWVFFTPVMAGRNGGWAGGGGGGGGGRGRGRRLAGGGRGHAAGACFELRPPSRTHAHSFPFR